MTFKTLSLIKINKIQKVLKSLYRLLYDNHFVVLKEMFGFFLTDSKCQGEELIVWFQTKIKTLTQDFLDSTWQRNVCYQWNGQSRAVDMAARVCVCALF